jgi:hypothetical protein
MLHETWHDPVGRNGLDHENVIMGLDYVIESAIKKPQLSPMIHESDETPAHDAVESNRRIMGSLTIE